MAKKELQNVEYAKFKEYIYEVYLRDLENPNKNVIEKQRENVRNYFKSEQLNNIFDNTIAFPFDTELYNALLGVKLSPDNLERIANEFAISDDLLVSKIKEYTMYPIGNSGELESINKEYICKLSELYADRKNEKNNKSVDFSSI